MTERAEPKPLFCSCGGDVRLDGWDVEGKSVRYLCECGAVTTSLAPLDAQPDVGAWIRKGSAPPKHYQVLAQACPCCEHLLDAATGGARKPSPGAFTVCIECATRLVFDEEMRLHELTGEQLAALPEDVVDVLNEIRSGVIAARIGTRKA